MQDVIMMMTPAPMDLPVGPESNAKPTARLPLVDDHELVRRGITSNLNERPGWDIYGEATPSISHTLIRTHILDR
jgi:hypothetical protein